MENRRVANRKRVLKGAKAVYGGYSFVVDCTIRDISETGVRLKMSASVTLPEGFLLYFPDTQTMRSVRVTWRKPGEVGVIYEGAPREIRDSSDPRERRLLSIAMV